MNRPGDEDLARLLEEVRELRRRIEELERSAVRKGALGPPPFRAAPPPVLTPGPEPLTHPDSLAETQPHSHEPSPAEDLDQLAAAAAGATSDVPAPVSSETNAPALRAGESEDAGEFPTPRESSPSESAPTAAPSAPSPPAPPKVGIEQRLGTSWLLKVGIVVMIIGAGFSLKFAADRGWIGPWVRVALIILGGVVLAGAGEWTWRKRMTIFAAGITAGGVALWYLAAYAASPKFYDLVPTPVAFVWMCAVTVLGVLLSLRSGTLATGILVQIGAYLTPLLLGSGRNEQATLVAYLAIVETGFLVLATMRRWLPLAPLAMLGTAGVFLAWWLTYFSEALSAATAVSVWVLWAPLLAWCLIHPWREARAADGPGSSTDTAPGESWSFSLPQGLATLATLLAFAAMGFALWSRSAVALPANWLALTAVFLAASLWRRWGAEGICALAWTCLGLCWAVHLGPPAASGHVWSAWIWAFFLLLGGWGLAYLKRYREPAFGLVGVIVPTVVCFHLLGVAYGPAHPGPVLVHWLAMAVVVLAVASRLRWHWLAAGLLGLVVVGVGALFRTSGDAMSPSDWCAWTWVFWGVFVAWSIVSEMTDRAPRRLTVSIALTASLGAFALIGLVSQVGGLTFAGLALWQWLVLDAIVLALADWRKWTGAVIVVLIWTAVGLAALCVQFQDASSPLGWSEWIWAFTAVLLAAGIRQALRQDEVAQAVGTVSALGAIAAMYAGTYVLLADVWGDWMGLYTFAVAAGTVGLSCALSAAGRGAVAASVLGLAMVLATVGMAVQFDGGDLVLAWAAQAVVASAVAKALENRVVAVTGLVAAGLAMLRLVAVPVVDQPLASAEFVAMAGVSVPCAVALAIATAFAAFAVAGILRLTRPLLGDAAEATVARAYCIAASAVLPIFFLLYLPAVTTTWWWLLAICGILAVALARRSGWLTDLTLVSALLAAGKIVGIDGMALRLQTASTGRWVVLNWQCTAGALAAATLLVLGLRVAKVHCAAAGQERRTVALLACGLLVLLAGSVEVDRVFAGPTAERWTDASLAWQAGMSVWWSVCATAFVLAGLLGRFAPIRFVALGVFAITLVKVFFVDMSAVETGYRIASLLALGLLMVGGAFLYHRYFRATAPDRPRDRETIDNTKGIVR